MPTETKYQPHPGRQRDFLRSTARQVFYGGARGGGKTFILPYKGAFTTTEWHYEFEGRKITKEYYKQLRQEGQTPQVISDKMHIDYPGFKGLLVRRLYPQLERNLKPECKKLFTLYGAEWKERDKKWVFPSGAEFYMVHCKDRRALDSFIGLNIDWGGIDEANQFYEEWVDDINSSIRTTLPNVNAQLCLTSNPGGIGHYWLKKRFVDRCPPIPEGSPVYSERYDITYQPMKPNTPYEDANGETYQYIPALVFDNPTLMENDPGYVQKLMNYPEMKRKMWLEGNWDVAPGVFFDNWAYESHVLSTSPDDEGYFDVKEELQNGTWQLYRFYDYGTKAKFVCLFAMYKVDARGPHLVIFDEIAKEGYSASQQADLINEYSFAKYGLAPDDFLLNIADPTMFHKTSQKDGELYSPAQFYEDRGIYLMEGNNNRTVGAAVVYEHLTPKPRPTIQLTDNCTYMIESLPTLPAKENDPDDIDTDAEDHGYDALRYGSMQLLVGKRQYTPKKKLGWRERLARGLTHETQHGTRKSWLAH